MERQNGNWKDCTCLWWPIGAMAIFIPFLLLLLGGGKQEVKNKKGEVHA